MIDSPSDERADLQLIIETLLLPALPAEGEILVTGDVTEALSDCCESLQPGSSIQPVELSEIMAGAATEFSQRDVLLVHDFRKANHNDHAVVLRLLGALRDRSAAKILHLVFNSTQRSGWSMSDSLAMGFIRRGAIELATTNCSLYEFSIKSYKSEPDWLNSRNWAHPSLWR